RPGVAAEQAPRRERDAAQDAATPDREHRVLGAARVVLAGIRRQERRHEQLVEPDREDRDHPAGGGHAAAFPSTSSTRAASQSWPFASAASGSPWRTTRT